MAQQFVGRPCPFCACVVGVDVARVAEEATPSTLPDLVRNELDRYFDGHIRWHADVLIAEGANGAQS